MSSSSSTSSSPSASKKAPEPPKRVYAYAHGFCSDEHSFKGTHFQKVLAEREGVHLHLLNMNGGEGKDLGGISYTGGIEAIQRLFESQGGRQANVQLTLLGSSLGGYVASRYAELHPTHVEKLVLFCPGYDLQSRWPKLFGEKALKEWEGRGYREFETRGRTVRVPWAFIEDGRRHPSFPRFAVPALVIHGLKDETVPVETTTQGLLGQGEAVKDLTQVLLVDDDHNLTKPKTLEVAAHSILEFLDIRGSKEAQNTTPSSSSTAANSADHIEVEAKFELVDQATLHAKILAAGGELKGAVIMTDEYWNLPGETFSLANVWLRRRSGIWELKVPAVEGEHPNTQAVACYREICGPDDIVAWLVAAFPEQLQPLAHLPLPALLQEAKAYPMAKYTTERSKYAICTQDGKTLLGIDVDQASFGFGLVEIEELVATPSEIPAAKARIQQCATEQLGLTGVDDVIRGKLEEFLLRHDSAHHQRLVDKLVFSKP